MSDKPRIITGQTINPEKLEFAKQLRKEMTSAESILWQALRGRKMAGLKFRRQQVILGFIADFFCDETSVVIEVEGSIHQTKQLEDAQRDAVFRELGLRVLRLPNWLKCSWKLRYFVSEDKLDLIP
jgi:very-short-patch-repair endonuclease